MSVTRSQHDQLDRIRQSIETSTELRAMEPLFMLGQPGSLQDRRFRFQLPASSYQDGPLPRLGEVLHVIDDLVIVVAHDIGPGDHDASWRKASDDVAAMLVGLASGPMRAFLTIQAGANQPEIAGSTILQRVALQYRYVLKIPAEAT